MVKQIANLFFSFSFTIFRNNLLASKTIQLNCYDPVEETRFSSIINLDKIATIHTVKFFWSFKRLRIKLQICSGNGHMKMEKKKSSLYGNDVAMFYALTNENEHRPSEHEA